MGIPMDAISIKDLHVLASDKTDMCVSIYMTTHPAGAEGEQDSLRWKKLLQEAEHGLMDRGLSATNAMKFLSAAYKLPSDLFFWQGRSQGLAAFISRQTFSCFRLPLPFDGLAVVNRRFQIKRLLPLMTDSSPFYILALSQNNARLFKASRFRIEQVEVAELPANMEEVLNYTSVDRGSQVHSATKRRFGKQTAIFHGQGGKSDTHKDDLAEFFRFVADEVEPVLTADPAPLLLAGVEYLMPIYRDVNSFSPLVEQHVAGNCDYLTPSELLVQAWPVMETALRKGQNEAVKRYTELSGTDRSADDIERVLAAAHQGRIDVLFVNPSRVQWGAFSFKDGTTKVHETRRTGDEDLLELAVAETLMKKGTVYATDPEQLPGDPNIAALFRY
jgi:hypothetical protein